jgi:hypothetical protein
MRRVKDQDEEGKGPGDQEDPGDQGTRGRGLEDQGTRGTLNCFSTEFIFFFQRLRFIFPVSSLIIPHFLPMV